MKNQPVDYPEFAVSRDSLSNFFSPPLAKSTFYDLVNRGKIFPVSGVRGYYRLNASLRKLGMPLVMSPPETRSAPGQEIRHRSNTDDQKTSAIRCLLDHLLQGTSEGDWLRHPKASYIALLSGAAW
ncbi:hypothetical protein [Luteolibacter luteus]|uniref:Uncharacterized protein n=1 Tax=Luteolibacter luteus TaxID=2728835 RepID=A0A858RG60_9BACT|nr:hypothetical protein [Luteolibacter luteus]QJE95280.1 hypothetical protein HHL09_05640 [Luteolibacter luteus]